MRANLRTTLNVFSETIRWLAILVCLLAFGWIGIEFLIFYFGDNYYGV